MVKYGANLISALVMVYTHWGVPKHTFFEFRFVGRITGANGCPRGHKKIQRYRPINDTWPLIFSIQGDIQGRISKNRFLAIKSCRNMLQPSS